MEIEQLNDGSVRITITIDGFSVSAVVESMELVEEKVVQLKDAIKKAALRSLFE